MEFPNLTNPSQSNVPRDAALAAQGEGALPRPAFVRPTPVTSVASPPNRQAALQATTGRERLLSRARRHAASSSLQPVIDAWLNTRLGVSFASLVAHRGGINTTDDNGKTLVEVALENPLREAAQSVTVKEATATAIVAALKTEGADLALPDADGNTLLHRLVMANNLAGIKTLLELGVDANALNTLTRPSIGAIAIPPIAPADMQRPGWRWEEVDDATPLHFAAGFTRDPQIICALLQAGADPNVRNNAQDSPLHWAAAFCDNTEIITTLLNNGADIEGATPTTWTPLAAACANTRNPCIASTLIDRGANVNTDDWATPAEYTILFNPAAAATLIPELKRAGADLELPGPDGDRLLHRAVMNGKLPSITALLDAGVEVNAFNTRTPPEIARYASDPSEIARLIEEAKVWWNADDTVTPLHLAAAFSNNPELVQLLLDHDAHVSLNSTTAQFPIGWAAALASNPAVIDGLMDAGANVQPMHAKEQSVLQLAAMINPHPAISNTFIDYGAPLEPADRTQLTPLQLATPRPTQTDVVRTLLRRGARADADPSQKGTPLKLAAEQSLRLELFSILHSLGLAQNFSLGPTYPTQRYLDSGITNNAGTIRALMTARANYVPGNDLCTNLIAQIMEIRTAIAEAPLSDWTREKKLVFFERFHFLNSPTILAFIRHGTVSSEPAPTRLSGQLRTTPAAPPADLITGQRQRQREDLRRLLANPLVRQVDHWYSNSDHAVRAFRLDTWQGISREPHADKFCEFLDHLCHTTEYRTPESRLKFVESVKTTLAAIQLSSELRQTCFSLVAQVDMSSEDEVINALNNLDLTCIEYYMHAGLPDIPELLNNYTQTPAIG